MKHDSREQLPVDGEIPPPRRDWACGVRPEVAKQHDVFAGAIAFGVLVSARASFWLDKKIRKLFECFHEDLPKPTHVPPTDEELASFVVS